MGNPHEGLWNRVGIGAACLMMMALGRPAPADAPATAAPPAFPPTSAPAAHDATYWNALETRLGAEDPKRRRAAQKELETITYRERGTLEALAKRATDDEIKSRLQERIEEIDEDLAVNPPPLTLHLKDAGMQEIVNALHQATRVSMTDWSNGGDETFTLDAQDQPFWKIFTELSAQYGLGIQAANSQLMINRQDPGLVRYFPATGGFVVFPNEIEHSRTADLQANVVGAEQLTFSYTLAADPRIKILRYSTPILTNVVDNAGNVLLHEAANNAYNDMQTYQTMGWFQSSNSLQIPDPMGTRIVSAAGEAHMVIQVATAQMDVDAPQDKIGKPIHIRLGTFTIQTFRPHDQTIDINFDYSSPPQPVQFKDGMARQSPIHLEVLGPDDQAVWSNTFIGGMSGGIGTGESKGPFKLRLSIPTRTKDVLVKFEMKDLPLPPLR